MDLSIFDINMDMINFVDEEIVVEAKLDVTINEAFTLVVSIPTKDDFPDNMRFIATPHPKYPNEYLVGQMARKQIDNDLTTYTFREYFYQQLDKGVISVEKPNFTNKPVADVLNYVLKKPAINWKLEEVMKKDISIYLYYDSGLEVFQRVQEILGGEYVFTCQIDPKSNKLINHKVRYIQSQGKKTGRRFERDTNLLSLKGDYDYNNIITLIYPRGKGVEVDNPEAPKNAPAGFGRRLTIVDANPTKKEWIVDEEATKVWGSMFGTRREEVVIYEDITDVQQLYEAGLRTLNERNHPLATWSASVTDVNDLDLGDEVFIIWRDSENKHKLEYSTRVFGYHYDLLNPDNNTLDLGDKMSSGNLNHTLNGMNRRIEQAQNVATWSGQTILGADSGFGEVLPIEGDSREGDTFYLNRDDGLVDMYVFVKGQWIKKASSDATDFGNRGIITGDGRVYYGEVNPEAPVAGDKWYKYVGEETFNARLHVYDGENWIGWGGISDANGIVTGRIDANKIDVYNLNAANITTGKLSANYIEGGRIDASKVDVVNLNAYNITTGSIHGPNLDINLDSGEATFQKGRIFSPSGTVDLNMNNGYLAVADGLKELNNKVLIKGGQLEFTQGNIFDENKDPYLKISSGASGVNFVTSKFEGKYAIQMNTMGYDSENIDLGVSKFSGISFGKIYGNGKLDYTHVGGAHAGVVVRGGTAMSDLFKNSPKIRVGSNASGTQSGNRVFIEGEYVHLPNTYSKTTSSSANVFVGQDGALVRSTSARKYKTNIKNDVSLADSEKLLKVKLSTWDDISELERTGKSERYFGMIAEDLADAGLDYLVTKDHEGEIEGIEYARVALLLVPMVKSMQEQIEELKGELKDARTSD